jgi:hypothetical protein
LTAISARHSLHLAIGSRRPCPAGPHDEKRILDTVLFLTWHEAYHIGAIGAMRREQGRKAIAELVSGS